MWDGLETHQFFLIRRAWSNSSGGEPFGFSWIESGASQENSHIVVEREAISSVSLDRGFTKLEDQILSTTGWCTRSNVYQTCRWIQVEGCVRASLHVLVSRMLWGSKPNWGKFRCRFDS